ncbi:MAG: Alpha/beta hydrolase [Verrucomicrobiales bacterium]|nr:Alpha/beta hydrolase [Verrucomicrobiales bacterium]
MKSPQQTAVLSFLPLVFLATAPAGAQVEVKKDPSIDEAVQIPVLPPKADPQMQAVLDKLASLGGEPIETLSPKEARKQPTPADAVMLLLKDQGKWKKEDVAKVDNISIELKGRDVKGRVYVPEGEGPFPVIFYIHGGGWVIADLDTYDATPRALANSVGAVVVSTHYRQAPEHKFPAAHNDVFGAYQWTLKNAHKWNANPKRIAVAGESAGGNMAASICRLAADEGIQLPLHQVLIYPVADSKMDTPSYIENAIAKPLSAPMMKWFADHTFESKEDAEDPKFALLKKTDLKGLPPVTIVTAQIDPLRSEGEALAEKFKQAGVPVSYQNYDGVTHEFFGMAGAVDKAKEAQAFVTANLKAAFADKPAE